MTHNNRIKYVLFDLDNTLYREDSGLMDAISRHISQYMVEKVGLEPAEVERLRTEYWHEYGTSLRGLMIHYHIDPTDYLAYVHDLNVSDYLKPDLALQAMLARMNGEKDIFTNATTEYAQRVLTALDIASYFSRIFDIEFLDYVNKPQKAAYRRVLEALPAKGPECLIVEDSVRNLMPAKELEMVTVLVDDGKPTPKEYVDFVVDGIYGLGEVVRKLHRPRPRAHASGQAKPHPKPKLKTA
jgi:putative hydrolase of the HAD superfamily